MQNVVRRPKTLRRIFEGRRLGLPRFPHADIQNDVWWLAECATRVISVPNETERLSLGWQHVTLTGPHWPNRSVTSATPEIVIGMTLSGYSESLGIDNWPTGSASASSYLLPMAVNAPVHVARKPIKPSSRWNMSAEAAERIGKRSAVTHMPIFAVGDTRRKVSPCFAGIAMQAADLRAYARTWKAE